jgi:glycosyltransferase involved in cell wall biosynthesis
LTVELGNPQGLTDTLHRLISDDSLAADIGARCRTRARQFDWNRSAEQIEQVFREALGE